MKTDSIFNKLKNNYFNNITLLTFEDQKIIEEVKSLLKYQNLNIISKADIIGKSIKDIIKLLRSQKNDLLIISNRNSQLNRSISSLKLLALFSKSKNQYLTYNDDAEEFYNKFSLFFNVIPKLVIGTLAGIFLILRSYIQLFLLDKFYNEKKTKRKNSSNIIAFIRADLAGKIIAGGSLSHIKGFVGGAKELGFRTYYLSDYPVFDENINYSIKPNNLFDFFDEFQLISYHFKFIREATKIFNEIKPDIIYQRHTVFNAIGVVLAKKFDIPLILEVNSSEVWVKKNWSRLVLEHLAKYFEKVCLKKANKIGVVSELIKDEIISLGADSNKIIINPNGVDINKFSPEIPGNTVREKYKLQNKIVVGFIGTFTKWHGVEILFEAALDIVTQAEKIVFLFIGDGNLKLKLHDKTKQLNLENRIIFTGLIPHSEAPYYLASCDILVSPHLGFETGEKFFGSPTKLFEYMAMGKAIIASDLEQIGKIIVDYYNGLKVKPGNVDELKSKILELSENEKLRKELGENSRKDVIKNYTWRMNAERVLLN